MNINLNKNLLTIVVCAAAAFGMLIVGGNILVQKISVKVVEELKRDYTPGPYHPGFDPDKVDGNAFKNPPKYGNNLGTPAEWNEFWNSHP